MCTECGCSHRSGPAIRVDGQPLARDGLRRVVDLGLPLSAANDAEAARVRAHLDAHGLRAVNLMSAPGSGKTALLEATAGRLAGRLRLGVIEGDLATDRDAERLRRHGLPAIQVTTGNACHLDATMVHAALHALPLAELDLVVIENVGNLVCPAAFEVGAHASVALLSMPEGDDKPAKYPQLFRMADLVVITKADLAMACADFAVDRATRYLRGIGSHAPVIVLSARSGAGLDAWVDWLAEQRGGRRASAQRTP